MAQPIRMEESAIPTTLPTTQPEPTPSQNPKKRKKKPSNNTTSIEFSIRKPTWTYIQLRHLGRNTSSNAPTPSLDAVTAHLHVLAALSAFLGLHGTAITVDILKLQDQDVWIRVPAEDRAAVVGAAGGWINGNGEGWAVKGWSSWNANAAGRDGGQDLFDG